MEAAFRSMAKAKNLNVSVNWIAKLIGKAIFYLRFNGQLALHMHIHIYMRMKASRKSWCQMEK
eukprot:6539396-Karenia_brevis.AAC.1